MALYRGELPPIRSHASRLRSAWRVAIRADRADRWRQNSRTARLSHALPLIRGPRVLEVSPGTGWLLTRYAGRFEAHAVDLNRDLVAIARENVRRAGLAADIRVGDVEALPYEDALGEKRG